MLALFRNDGERRLSAMIDGSPNVAVCNYTELEEAFVAINGFVQSLQVIE